MTLSSTKDRADAPRSTTDLEPTSLSPIPLGSIGLAEDHDMYEELPPTAPPSISLLAGALAGIAEHTVTFPLDSIKTRLQVLRPGSAVYTGVLDAAQKIQSKEGLSRLWRGVWSVVVGAGPAHALYFATYEQAKRVLLVDKSQTTQGSQSIRIGVAGALATAVSDAVMTPFDVIKQRMQVHNSPYTQVWQCGRAIFRQEGFRSFYISYPTTLLLNVPFHMIQFPTYEWIRELLNPDQEYRPLAHVVAGGTAGGIAAALTTPIDVIKTTLQTRGLATSDDPLAKVRGMREAIQLVLSERGWLGFSRGALPRFLAFMPATAVCWTTYEYFKWMLMAK